MRSSILVVLLAPVLAAGCMTPRDQIDQARRQVAVIHEIQNQAIALRPIQDKVTAQLNADKDVKEVQAGLIAASADITLCTGESVGSRPVIYFYLVGVAKDPSALEDSTVRERARAAFVKSGCEIEHIGHLVRSENEWLIQGVVHQKEEPAPEQPMARTAASRPAKHPADNRTRQRPPRPAQKKKTVVNDSK